MCRPGEASYKNIVSRSSYYTTYTIPAYYAYTAAYYQYNAVYYVLKTAAYYKYTAAYYQYNAAYNVLKTAAYYNYYTQTSSYNHYYYYYWLESGLFATYLAVGDEHTDYESRSLYQAFYWPRYFIVTESSAYNMIYYGFSTTLWINGRGFTSYMYVALDQIRQKYSGSSWTSGADFDAGCYNAIIIPYKGAYSYTTRRMHGTIILDSSYFHVDFWTPYYYGTYYTGYYYDYDEDSATVYYTTKFYSYTAAVYYTVPAYYKYTSAYYAYTAPVYSTIPAYYKYTAAYYQYIAPKYYQPIHYTYAYV